MSAGPVGAAAAFSTAATSAAWHSSQPGRLAWIHGEAGPGEPALATLDLAAGG